MALHPFGTTGEGVAVTEAVLTLPSGATASILDYGAIVRDLLVPDQAGGLHRVVLGHNDLPSYLADKGHMGAIAGRYANRIAGGRFELDGKIYRLARNSRGDHHIHGGLRGFGRQHWRIVGHDEASVTLALISPDGDEGYPGELAVNCTYRLLPPATLAIEMTAMTDAPTVVNLAHHSYFTLNYGQSIRDHIVQVNANRYTPSDADSIPTGEIVSVAGTPYDFWTPRPLQSTAPAPDFVYDINFALNRTEDGLLWAATVAAPDDALWMEVHTTEPGMQLYDGAYVGTSTPGLDGRMHFRHAGLCLEPQKFPASPNRPNFPSAVLRPDAVSAQRTEYRFGAGPANWRS
jgi:aldose 1-epimerase